MPEIAFYGILHTNIYKVLAVLLEKSLKVNKACHVLADNLEESEYVNKYLWSSVTWLPHCVVGAKEEPHTPIVIDYVGSNQSLQKQQEYLFCINNTDHSNITDFQKVFIVFNLQEPEVAKYNRQRWKNYSQNNYVVNFYQQNLKGAFEKQI